MPSASSWIAARTMSATLRLWPRCTTSAPVRLQQAADHVDRRVVPVEERRGAHEAQRRLFDTGCGTLRSRAEAGLDGHRQLLLRTRCAVPSKLTVE